MAFRLSTPRHTLTIFDESNYPMGEATWLSSQSTIHVQWFDGAPPYEIRMPDDDGNDSGKRLRNAVSTHLINRENNHA
jgi:hypothetical protein